MSDSAQTTLPKPFVFVLMPFEKAFDDVYKLGIKAAAEAAGTYAERVDEQSFTERILDRIYNQISKADVIVADMSGRNPNVFYEVGYAHALGKTVLLVTKHSDDIPFDLKHHPHIIYRDSIASLKEELTKKILWAVTDARNAQPSAPELLTILVKGWEVKPSLESKAGPTVVVDSNSRLDLSFVVRNDGPTATSEITHMYLFTREDPSVELGRFEPRQAGAFGLTAQQPLRRFDTSVLPLAAAPRGLQLLHRLPGEMRSIPPAAFEIFRMHGLLLPNHRPERLILRLITERGQYDFEFGFFFVSRPGDAEEAAD